MKKMFTIFAGILLSFHGFSQSWSLTGNAGTNPDSNFLGTTDAQRLVFRTTNLERMTISSAGNLGIGTTTPALPLSITNGSVDNFIRLSGNAPSVQFISGTTSFTSLGKLGFASGTAEYVSTSKAGDFILQDLDTAGSLIFGTNFIPGNGLERMRINPSGYVGIATATPTAKFDVNCAAVTGKSNPSNIRLENLQSGSGTVLVIDSNGYVYRSASGATAAAVSSAVSSTPLATDLQQQIEELKNQVQELRALLSTRLQLTSAQANSLKGESAAWLGANYPNPSNGTTTIEYSLPEALGAATCQVFSLDGRLINTIVLSPTPGKGRAQLGTVNMPSGMYIYSLTVNGKVVDTKKLTVTH